MDYKYLSISEESEGRFWVISLCNEKQLNALHSGILRELAEVFRAISAASSLRGVVLRGSGQRAFAAGADIKEFADFTVSTAYALACRGQEIFSQIAACQVPVIAAVEGYALGGGCELALACHMRIASRRAIFGQPEITLGLIPGYGATQRLVDCVGRARALEWILTGKNITAQEALEAGLVNAVVPSEELVSASLSLLKKIATFSPLATQAALSCVQQAHNASLSQGLAQEAAAFALTAASAEGKAGVNAFLEKRKSAQKRK